MALLRELPQHRQLRWIRVRRALVDYLPAALLLVGLVLFWEAWVEIKDTRPYILPAPSQVWEAFLHTRQVLPDHTRTTMNEALLGLVAGAGIGVVLAAAMVSVALIRRVLYPLVVISQTIPMIVLAPLLAIWFGLGMTPKVVVVMLISFFPVLVSTTEALLTTDRDLVAMVRSMGANRLQLLRYVLLPSAIPGFYSGLKIAAAYAVTGAVVGEWMGASSGLGLYITRSQNAFRTDQVFVGIVLVALLSLALFAAVHVANRLSTPWMFVKEGEER